MPDNSPGNINQSPSVVATSITERKKTPVSLTLCTLALAGVAGCWLIAGYFVQNLQPIYPNPTAIAYICIISLQIYFIFVSVPPAFPSHDDEIGGGEDLLISDVYTNRETAKIALYLFIPFGIAFSLIVKGLSLFPQSSYCGGMALQSGFALILILTGLAHETITRFKVCSVVLMTIAALLTLAEPALWKDIKWLDYASIGYILLISGIFLFALIWVLIARLTEHTSIQKPLIFAFIGLLWMLIGWVAFIPLHLFSIEPLNPFPPDPTVYWYILIIVLTGAIVPIYLLQWTLTRTSVLFVSVAIGAIIPLHGIAESIYRFEWNWVDFGASIISLAAIILVNYRYKA